MPMVVVGNCMSPGICDGETLVFHRDSLILMKDIVVIYRDPARVQPGEHQAIVKRFMGYGRCDAGEGVVIEFDNPPTQGVIPNDQILAMHRCLGRLPDDAKRYVMKQEEVAFV